MDCLVGNYLLFIKKVNERVYFCNFKLIFVKVYESGDEKYFKIITFRLRVSCEDNCNLWSSPITDCI